MKKILLFASICGFLVAGGTGVYLYQRHQRHSQHLQYIAEGDQYYQAEEYLKAQRAYEQAFRLEATAYVEERIRLAKQAFQTFIQQVELRDQASRQNIAVHKDQLARVCEGQGIEQLPVYKKTPGIHPIYIVR